MSKRALEKYQCVDEEPLQDEPKIKIPKSLSACQTYEAFKSVNKFFPCLRFYNKIPPVAMIHQLYDLVPSRTIVDREVNNLRSGGVVCVFQLGIDLHSRAIIFAEDMFTTAEICYPGNNMVAKFLQKIIPLGLIEIEKTRLEGIISKAEVKELIHYGYLVLKDANSYSLSFPNAGNFVRAFVKGRKALLNTIKKSKYDQILNLDLLERPLEKVVVLGTKYQIHDVIGADLVNCTKTTSGRMLKINQNGIRVLKK